MRHLCNSFHLLNTTYGSLYFITVISQISSIPTNVNAAKPRDMFTIAITLNSTKDKTYILKQINVIV